MALSLGVAMIRQQMQAPAGDGQFFSVLGMQFVLRRLDTPRSADVSPQAIVRWPAGEASPTPALHGGNVPGVHASIPFWGLKLPTRGLPKLLAAG